MGRQAIISPFVLKKSAQTPSSEDDSDEEALLANELLEDSDVDSDVDNGEDEDNSEDEDEDGNEDISEGDDLRAAREAADEEAIAEIIAAMHEEDQLTPDDTRVGCAAVTKVSRRRRILIP